MTAPPPGVVDHGWSWELTGPPTDPAPVEAAAQAAGVLDLRATGPGWDAHGFVPLAPGSAEVVRPVPLVLPDLAATRALGARLAGLVRAGDLLVLSGPLGAGKTALTAGLGAALGVRGAVTSPSFVLARVHRGPLPLVHVDAYRLREAGSGVLDLDDLDLDAALEDAVTVVEWGEGLVEGLAAASLGVRLERETGGPNAVLDPGTEDLAAGRRTATVQARGERWSVVQPHKVTGGTRDR